MNRITIFTGHFGSGKTEVALNYAVQNGKNAVVDLDIVNPYFRTKDAQRQLDKLGIEVIASTFAGSNVDLPALPADISRAFDDTSLNVVFDVGGDDDGSIALGRYHARFITSGYEMLMVVNTRRPQTAAPEGILEMIAAIEQASRLKIGGLVNNTNILHFTTKQDIMKGQAIVAEAARLAGLPLALTCAPKPLAAELGVDNPVMGLDLFLDLEWRN